MWIIKMNYIMKLYALNKQEEEINILGDFSKNEDEYSDKDKKF